MIQIALGYALPFLLLLLGISAGGFNERRHLRSLDRREADLGSIRTCNLKTVSELPAIRDATMVTGQVVIATDYFKTFATSLRNLVGGRMRAAESLMARARREALVRMLEQARQAGAGEVYNVRFGFSNISHMRGKRGVMQVEVIAWGTAIVRSQSCPRPNTTSASSMNRICATADQPS